MNSKIINANQNIMEIFVKIIYGIMLIGTGFLMIKYRKTVKSWTGNFVWAERYIGNGGTYFVILLLGLLLMFLGVVYPFGLLSQPGSDSRFDEEVQLINE